MDAEEQRELRNRRSITVPEWAAETRRVIGDVPDPVSRTATVCYLCRQEMPARTDGRILCDRCTAEGGPAERESKGKV